MNELIDPVFDHLAEKRMSLEMLLIALKTSGHIPATARLEWLPDTPTQKNVWRLEGIAPRLSTPEQQLAALKEIQTGIEEAGESIALLRALVTALRVSFPHFQNGEEITAEAVAQIGKEYTDLVMAPAPAQINFFDQDGRVRHIVLESPDEGPSAYFIPDGADWMVQHGDAEEPAYVTPREAVTAFAAMLTVREKPMTLSAHHGAADIAKLAGEWCDFHELEPIRPDFPKRLRKFDANPVE